MDEDDYQMAHVVVDLESVMLIFSNYIYALLTKREVKKAGYWPSSFLPLLDSQDDVQGDKNANKNPAILTEQAWSKKDLFYGQKENLFLQD